MLSGTILTVFISKYNIFFQYNEILSKIFSVLYTDQIPWHIGHRTVDFIAKQFGYFKPVYGVVIDAGSTGSRVLAFTFHESYFGKYLQEKNG